MLRLVGDGALQQQKSVLCVTDDIRLHARTWHMHATALHTCVLRDDFFPCTCANSVLRAHAMMAVCTAS